MQELRILELEENIRRKDLTEYEKNKAMVEYVEAVKEETCSESEQVSTPNRGPSRTPGSYRDIEQRTGLPASTVKEAQSHVETADLFPFMQPWPQYRVLEAREVVGMLPVPARARSRCRSTSRWGLTWTCRSSRGGASHCLTAALLYGHSRDGGVGRGYPHLV